MVGLLSCESNQSLVTAYNCKIFKIYVRDCHQKIFCYTHCILLKMVRRLLYIGQETIH